MPILAWEGYTVSRVKRDEDREKRKGALFILIILILVFGFVFFICKCFGVGAPSLGVSTPDWGKKVLVSVVEDARTNKKIAYYEYCILDNDNQNECQWERTDTKNVELSTSGEWYVWFRAVTEDGEIGYSSKPQIVKIDNANPTIEKITKTLITEDSITIAVSASDKGSGIAKYLYSLDGINYQEGEDTFTFSNLDSERKYRIFVKVIDGLGNEIVVSEEVETAEPGEVIEVPYTSAGTARRSAKKDSTTPEEGGSDTPSEPEWDIPTISLEGIPTSFTYGEEYDLPTSYDFGNDNGTVQCTVDGEGYSNTKTITTGSHLIKCEAKSDHNNTASVMKQVEVNYSRSADVELDGWIRLNLYYPENSTNWEWRLDTEDDIRTGYNGDGWQAYTGPILVKVDDIQNIYIRYDMNGETYIIAPNGKITVDIEPDIWSLKEGQETTVRINYDKTAATKEYRINKGEWMTYEGSFTVGPNTLIEARVSRVEDVYNNIGELQYSKTISSADNAFVSEIIPGDTIPSTPPEGPVPIIYVVDGEPGPDGGTIITTPEYPKETESALDGPAISENPTVISDEVLITITTAETARKVYYSIDNGSWKEYTEPFIIDKNCKIKAYYVRESDGKTSRTSVFYVENIKVPGLPYVKISTTPGRTLTDTVESVTVAISGSDYDTLEYSLDGNIYTPYTGQFEVHESVTIYAKGTNANGQTIETATITTKNPPVQKDNLDIYITANPDVKDVIGLVNKTTITINYDSRATKKYYRLNYSGNWIEYTGPFEVTSNATVSAYCTSDNGRGDAEYDINFLTTGITSPKITTSPSDPAPEVQVSIAYHKNADVKKYKIDNGEWQVYTGPFYVNENVTIYAYNKDVLGNEAESSKTIKNIKAGPEYTAFDKGSYYIIKLNYPDVSDPASREYKWKTNGTWKQYDEKGIVLIKPEYAYLFGDITDGVTVLDNDGNEVVFTDHYYLLDVPLSELSENLFMRWNNEKPKAPTIIVDPADEPTKEVNVAIVYADTLIKKYYKVVAVDGTDSGWLEYNGVFKVSKNSTVYAKGMNRLEIESEVASTKISNIDEIAPTIELKADLTTPKQKVAVTVMGDDNLAVDAVKYAKGSQTIEYFANNGQLIENNATIIITENGTYTFYVKDKVGNEIKKEIVVSNIDSTAPDITIINKTTGFGIAVNIEIDFGDSTTKQYSIGNNTNYVNYTDEFIINAGDYYQYANEDGSITIYAKGQDVAGNTTEVSEKIYNLDLDMPAVPVITSHLDYPLFTEEGFTVYDKITVAYDDRTDTINYVDIGDGYTVYEGPISIEGGVIKAKSVKKDTGLTRETSKEINFPSDALLATAFDGDPTTSSIIAANGKQQFKVSTNNKSVIMSVKSNAASGSKVKIYGTDNTVAKEVDITSANTSIRLPSGATRIELVASASGLSISEIEVSSVITKIIGDSILDIVQNHNFSTGYYIFEVADEEYSVHMYGLNGNQTIEETTLYGDAGDVGTANTYAENMVIVKVNGDYTVNSGVTVGPYYNNYGGPKGFMLYVTGKLTNNGTINNSHGAYAKGQEVYLWKNSKTNDYEYIPTQGANGAEAVSGSNLSGKAGSAGSTKSTRALGGGGGGALSYSPSYGSSVAGAGAAGTSYSGGSAGAGSSEGNPGVDGKPNGGAGGAGNGWYNNDYTVGGGAGNPSKCGYRCNLGANSTGGLLIIYSDEFENTGNINANGGKGGNGATGSGYSPMGSGGGGSGGGSINIFTNQPLGIDSLGTVVDTLYNSIKGATNAAGGAGGSARMNNADHNGGAGGAGTVNIGEIREGQYYDLKTIIQQDIEAYEDSISKKGDSIFSILEDDTLEEGYWTFKVTTPTETIKYGVHLYVYDGDQVFNENKTFGSANDVATGETEDKMAKNMVIVKVNGDLTINSDVTVAPYYNTSYGGPKGFMLYVTGKLTNNGTINQRHGAFAKGENVYLWKNADGTYEYIPAEGANGAAAVSGSSLSGKVGSAGSTKSTRALGGGGGGALSYSPSYGSSVAGAGAAGTSYSGGSAGAGSSEGNPGVDGKPNGGAGGAGNGWYNDNYKVGGGAGNPSKCGYRCNLGENLTGGLLIIRSNEFSNSGNIIANGGKGGNGATGSGYSPMGSGGGGSGGGSINIFTNQSTGVDRLGIVTDTRYNEIKGATNVAGGAGGSARMNNADHNGGAGGAGTVNIGVIREGQYYDLKTAINMDKEAYQQSVTVTGESLLSILDNNDLTSGYYVFSANGVMYPVHLYTLEGDQTIVENTIYGDITDCASGTAANMMAQNTVIVKVKGDYTVNSGATVSSVYNSYGGPKGFMLYVTGKLTNNGTISNNHGAYATGQDVYLWKNAISGDYEFISAAGAAGGAGSSGNSRVAGKVGSAGSTKNKRALGGGGSGALQYGSSSKSGSGGTGSSFSGGAGGGSSSNGNGGSFAAGDGSSVGGAGGAGGATYSTAGGGAGNPGGAGGGKGSNGTGGLLIIYANDFQNSGKLEAIGSAGGSGNTGGGGSGGGSINIFTNKVTGATSSTVVDTMYNSIKGNTNVSGGAAGKGSYSVDNGGAGGAGTVNIGEIRNGQYYDLKTIIQQDKDAL